MADEADARSENQVRSLLMACSHTCVRESHPALAGLHSRFAANHRCNGMRVLAHHRPQSLPVPDGCPIRAQRVCWNFLRLLLLSSYPAPRRYGDKLLAMEDGSGRCSEFVGATLDLVAELASLVKKVGVVPNAFVFVLGRGKSECSRLDLLF
jgi:hypothetical protein